MPQTEAQQAQKRGQEPIAKWPKGCSALFVPAPFFEDREFLQKECAIQSPASHCIQRTFILPTVRVMNEQSIFISALELTPTERRVLLDDSCGANPVLRQRIEKLLLSHEKNRNFMDQPAGLLIQTPDQSCPEQLGTMIGPYKLRELLGEGGMGTVYVAQQEYPIRRKVALKLIKPGMDTREVLRRFEAERQALALMDHPHIARVYDAGTTESGRPYFVMELIRGMPITDYCDEVNASLRERLELFIQVCLAVQHAHQKGIIHRDLKPSNVMITIIDGQAVPKIIDFGVAKAIGQRLTEHSVYTQHMEMVGTPLYMSPEQAGLSGVDIDTRSDVYSLGVLLYELLTGATPLEKERLSQVGFDEMRRIIREEEPPRPSQRISTLVAEKATTISQNRGIDSRRLIPMLRRDLDWIVVKALEKHRQRRYESAEALAADVQRHLDDQPVKACAPSWGYRLQKFVRRNRRTLNTLAILVVSVPLAVVGLFSLILKPERVVKEYDSRVPPSHDTEPPTEVAAKPLPNARAPGRTLPGLIPEPPPIPVVGRWQLITKKPRGVIRSAVWNREETLFAFAEANHVRIYDTTSLQLLHVLVAHSQPVTSVTWHPDGKHLASCSEDGTVRLWTVDGIPTHTLIGHTGPVYKISWRPDGERLASASADGTVRLWNAEGDLVRTLDEGDRHVFGLDWSPDGQLLATVGGDIRPAGPGDEVGDNSVRLWNPDTAKLVRRIMSTVGYSALCVDWRPDGRQLAVGYGHVYRQMHWGSKPLPDAGVRIWNSDGTPGPELGRDNGSVSALAWRPDGRQLAFGGREGTIWIWDDYDHQVTDTQIAPKRDLVSISWSRDDGKLLVTSRDLVREWDGRVTAVSLVAGIGPDFGFSNGIWSPDGTIVAAEDGTGAYWFGTPDGVTLPTPERPTEDVQAWWDRDQPNRRPGGKTAPTLDRAPLNDWATKFAWSKDGWLAAATWHDQTVRIWNDAGKLVATCQGHRGGVESVSWSPDGTQVVSGGGDSVRIWNRDGTAGPVMTGHTDEVYGVAWSPDGQWIASGGTDSTVRLWKPNGTPGPVLKGHQGGVMGVAWSPDSQKLVSTSWLDNTLRVWDIATGRTEWQVLCLNEKTTVTLDSVGFPIQGDADVLESSLLYIVEGRNGAAEVMTMSEFASRYGAHFLSGLVQRFTTLLEAHELARCDAELTFALSVRARVDAQGRILIGALAEQLARARYFERDYGRAEQAMRMAIEIQQQAVNELPGDPAQKGVLSSRWLQLGTYLSAAGRNTEGLNAITTSITITQELIKSEQDNKALLASLAWQFYERAQRQPTLEAALADVDRIREVDPDLHRLPDDFVCFLDDLVEKPADPTMEQVRDIAAEQQIEIAKAVYLAAVGRLQKVPHDRRFADWLSSVPERFRDPELALQVARWAATRVPPHRNKDFLRSLAWADFCMGDAQECIATLDKIDSHGDDSEFIRAMAYQSLGNTSEAHASFDRGTEWSKDYLQTAYVTWWKENTIRGPTPGTVRRLQAEAAAMLSAAENKQLSVVADPPPAASDQ